MSILRTFLDKSYPQGMGLDSIEEKMQDLFGVIVKQHNGLFLFKYSMLEANWQEALTYECRGAILHPMPTGWMHLSRPFDKFFNLHEGHCKIFEPSAFKENLDNLHAMVKADGSCIQVWHNPFKGWQASTLGMIQTGEVQDENFTFEELFFNTVKLPFDKMQSKYTYIFELCCEENRIVTKYSNNQAFLLGIRDNHSGEILDRSQLEEVVSHMENVSLPLTKRLNELGIGSKEDMYAYAENEANNHDLYGEYPEGFVLYHEHDWWEPVAKVKNSKYIALHGTIGGGDLAHSKNQIIDAIFNGHFDDIESALTDRLKTFAQSVKDKIADIRHETFEGSEGMWDEKFQTRKDYALYVNSKIPKEMRAFFFQNAEDFMKQKPNDLSERFESWLTQSYKRFEWK